MLQGFFAPVRELRALCAELSRRVEQLEREQLDREAAVNDLLDKLARYYKRQRQRERRDASAPATPASIQDIILARRRSRFAGASSSSNGDAEGE